MKFLKVTAIAAAMAASFGAQAELTAMDDAALEAVTGQKSINVVLTNGGSGDILTTDFAYDDTDGGSAAGVSGASGALFMEGTRIIGSGAGGTMSVTIDVVGDGAAAGITDALLIDISGMSVQDTTLRIGASGGAFGSGLVLGRQNMTFNGTVQVAVGAE